MTKTFATIARFFNSFSNSRNFVPTFRYVRRGRLIWDSEVKGTYVKKKHGPIGSSKL